MNWEAVGALSDMIGAVAVVVSVAYLAYQIRQNTKQLEQNERTSIAGSVSVSATSYRENRQTIYGSHELADLNVRGMADPDSLSEVERYRFRLLTSNFVDANWDMYVQTFVTGFSPVTWTVQGRKVIRRVLSTPGGLWFWHAYREEYPEEFRLEVDRTLESGADRDVVRLGQ